MTAFLAFMIVTGTLLSLVACLIGVVILNCVERIERKLIEKGYIGK